MHRYKRISAAAARKKREGCIKKIIWIKVGSSFEGTEYTG
jgi:hypothetical protein